MRITLLRVLVASLWIGFCVAHAQNVLPIAVGNTKDEVIEKLGKPQGVLQQGNSETLIYKDIEIDFKNGHVVRVNCFNDAFARQMAQRSQAEKPQPPITNPGKDGRIVSSNPQPVTPATPVIPNGTTHWPSAPGDNMCADRFGDTTYPFAYGEPPRDVLENHEDYWRDAVEFYYFVNSTFYRSPEFKIEDQRALVSYFRLEKQSERQAVEQSNQQSQHALTTHPRYSIYMLLVHLERANRDYSKARDIFIRTEGLSFAKPFALNSASKPESQPLKLMLKDALARMYYCRTRLAKEFPAYCDRDNACVGVTEFNPDPDWKQVGGKAECPWTDPGWYTYTGDTDFTYNDFLGRNDATLFRGQRVTGSNVTGQTVWFIVKNFDRKTAPRINTGIIQAIVLRCTSLGTQPTPNTIVDRLEQRGVEWLDCGIPAPPNAGRTTKQIADARNAARKEVHDRLRNWKIQSDALALDELERRYLQARATNPDLDRAGLERAEWQQQRQQLPREQRLQAELQQEEHRLANQKQRLTEQSASSDADAKYKLAIVYLQGQGCTPDPDKGNALMKEAAELGDVAAKCYLRDDGPRLTAEQFQQWLREARVEVERLQKEADAGSAKAKRQLCKAYTWGYGVSSDATIANRLCREAEKMESGK